MKAYYLAGPMRGYPRYNFDAFDAAEADLTARGMNIISPAAMDREVGFNPDTDIPDEDFLRGAMRRDLDALQVVDGIIMLPGWNQSVGATAEMWVARWRGIEMLSYPTLEPLG